MAQALSPDGSCQQAVNDAAVKRLVGGLKPCSTSTSAYCQAQARLPLTMISTLTRQTGEIITQEAISRHVRRLINKSEKRLGVGEELKVRIDDLMDEMARVLLSDEDIPF